MGTEQYMKVLPAKQRHNKGNSGLIKEHGIEKGKKKHQYNGPSTFEVPKAADNEEHYGLPMPRRNRTEIVEAVLLVASLTRKDTRTTTTTTIKSTLLDSRLTQRPRSAFMEPKRLLSSFTVME